MLQLWRTAKGDMVACRPFRVSVPERRALTRLLADEISTAWLKALIDSFPSTFQNLYVDAWNFYQSALVNGTEWRGRAGGHWLPEYVLEHHFDQREVGESEDVHPDWFLFEYSLVSALSDFADVLVKAGCAACITDACRCGERGYDHYAVYFMHPSTGDTVFRFFVDNDMVWYDPPGSTDVNTKFVRDFAERRVGLTDLDWGFESYAKMTQMQWERFCAGEDDLDPEAWGGDEGYDE